LLAGAALSTLLASRPRSGAAWAFEGLGALLRLPARLAFVVLLVVLLLALVLRVFALCNHKAAVCSTRAVKRDAQLWNRNCRHQGAGEQNIAKLLQLSDVFEWQGALLKMS
jgi:non-ribosomal peptide synthetase component E (peptide arylation enzyme)